jgi:hypothetical protein
MDFLEIQIIQDTFKMEEKLQNKCQMHTQRIISNCRWLVATTTNMHPLDKPNDKGIKLNNGPPLCCPQPKKLPYGP